MSRRPTGTALPVTSRTPRALPSTLDNSNGARLPAGCLADMHSERLVHTRLSLQVRSFDLQPQ